MTLEAKFIIKDPGIFWSLQTIDRLEKYAFSAPQIIEIHDEYLDTKKRRLLDAGYSCRRRDQDKGVLITLLKLGSTKDAIKKPQKWKVSLKKNSNNPVDWPKSQVRKRVVKLISGKKLGTIIALHQSRITRLIRTNDQVIAQANLDNVSMVTGGNEQQFKTLKLKMVGHNQEKHLINLMAALQKKWPLETEPLSKFEHVLVLEKRKTK